MAERISEIYSLLIPLLDGRLIIPRSCVAEVVGFSTPSEMPGAPPWYLGSFAWGSRNLPLGSQIEGGYYGMVSQGFPQLVRVSADILRPDPTKTFPERTPIISQVRMINEAPWIPDLERIEEMISEETSVLVE